MIAVLLGSCLLYMGCSLFGMNVPEKLITVPYGTPEMWERLLSEQGPIGVTQDMRAFVLPHHLITASYLTRIYRQIGSFRQPRRIILLSPNHYEDGEQWAQSCLCTFQAPDGTQVHTDVAFIRKLETAGVVTIRPEPFVKEHGVYGHIPFISRYFPGTQVVPIILKLDTPATVRKQLAEVLETVDNDTIVIASVDFSHYLPHLAADFHDATSWATLHNFDFSYLSSLEVDSPATLEVALAWAQAKGLQKPKLLAHTNSQDFFLPQLLDVTTSHLMVGFAEGKAAPLPLTTLHFFGDTMIGRGTEAAFLSGSTLKDLQGDEKRFFYGAHANLLNLEGPFRSDLPAQQKEVVLTQDPGVLAWLKNYGFRSIDVANNHTRDFFAAGEELTKRLLSGSGLVAMGGYEAGSESDCVPIQGSAMTVAVCSFNDVGHVLDVDTAMESVRRWSQFADAVVVQMHWGEEYTTQPVTRQRALAKKFIGAGARLIVGHHPHVVQDTEMIDGIPVIYSLGNFVFDQEIPPATRIGLSLGVTLTPKTTELYLLPFWTNGGAPRQMTESERREWLRQHSAGLQDFKTALPGEFIVPCSTVTTLFNLKKLAQAQDLMSDRTSGPAKIYKNLHHQLFGNHNKRPLDVSTEGHIVPEELAKVCWSPEFLLL